MDLDYLLPCPDHLIPKTLFCTECLKFKCSKCEDEHIFKGKILPSWFIEKYLLATNTQSFLPSPDQIDIAKTDLSKAFADSQEKLTASFKKALANLDTIASKCKEYDQCCSDMKEMGCNDKVFAVLNSLANSRKEEDVLYATQEKSFQLYIDGVKDEIKEIIRLSTCFESMLTFFKTTERVIHKTVHYWSGNTLTIYHPDNSTKRVYNLKKPINEYSDSIAYLNRIFIAGGNGPSAETFEVDYKEGNLIPKDSMKCKKYWHTLCLEGDFIYSVGGTHNGSEAYNDCEKYSISQNKWEPISNLNAARICCCSFSFNKTHLYTFAGYYAGSNNLNSLERYSILTQGAWEVMTVKNPCGTRFDVHGIQTKKNEAIVFGHSKNVT
jgi:hypothetical protein